MGAEAKGKSSKVLSAFNNLELILGLLAPSLKTRLEELSSISVCLEGKSVVAAIYF